MAKSKKGSKKKKHINIDVSYDDDKDSICSDKKDIRWHKHIACKAEKGGCGGFFYFLGFIGAAIYYLSTATYCYRVLEWSVRIPQGYYLACIPCIWIA